MEGRVQRRLAAILAADVAGYSRLMHDDEEATHSKLRSLLADAVAPAISEHGGRIVKNTGDGFLAEFPSAVEAVRAAVWRVEHCSPTMSYRLRHAPSSMTFAEPGNRISSTTSGARWRMIEDAWPDLGQCQTDDSARRA